MPQSSWSADLILKDAMAAEVYEIEGISHPPFSPSMFGLYSNSCIVEQSNHVPPEIWTHKETEYLKRGSQDNAHISVVYSNPTMDENETMNSNTLKYKPKPSIISSELQTRGRLLAQPLIDSEEMETFFDLLEECLRSRFDGSHPQELELIIQAVSRARMWVTYPFLGIIQLIHQSAEALPGVAPLNLLINAAWVFLKTKLENWQKKKGPMNSIPQF